VPNEARVTNVFVAGSRRVSHLGADVRRRLDEMIQREFAILVGDANGADKAVQTHFAERSYTNVTVFCTAGDCRNNVGGWPVRAVPAPHRVKDFAFFTAKDTAMADEADVGLMLWDGQSTGTMVNVARLVARGKISVIYFAPQTRFLTVKTPEDLVSILSATDPKVRAKIEESIGEHVTEFAQPQMF
jgi:hypothetical protein